MQAQPTRTRGTRINRWIGAAIGMTVLAILALTAFSTSTTAPFRETAGQAQVATQLETSHDLSNHRHTELTSMSAVPVVHPATRLEDELVLTGHRYKLYLNEGIITSSASAAAATRSIHRYDLLEQQHSSTADAEDPTHRPVARRGQ